MQCLHSNRTDRGGMIRIQISENEHDEVQLSVITDFLYVIHFCYCCYFEFRELHFPVIPHYICLSLRGAKKFIILGVAFFRYITLKITYHFEVLKH